MDSINNGLPLSGSKILVLLGLTPKAKSIIENTLWDNGYHYTRIEDNIVSCVYEFECHDDKESIEDNLKATLSKLKRLERINKRSDIYES